MLDGIRATEKNSFTELQIWSVYFLSWAMELCGWGGRAKKSFKSMFKLYGYDIFNAWQDLWKYVLYMFWKEKYMQLVLLFSDMIYASYIRFRVGGRALSCILEPLAPNLKLSIINYLIQISSPKHDSIVTF